MDSFPVKPQIDGEEQDDNDIQTDGEISAKMLRHKTNFQIAKRTEADKNQRV